jgi:LPPG:FO 2-phospho-L-lactate transferase
MRAAIVNGCVTLSNITDRQMKIVELSGGVGGARLARGLAALADVDLTVVVNVGDDAETHGLSISPDLDTVVYTLAGEEGSEGWGRRGDTFRLNSELARFGVDNTFRLGDHDLALKLFRTIETAAGAPLSKVTDSIARSFGIESHVIPATDDRLRTMVRIPEGWVTFQEYFVGRRHQDEVLEVRFDGDAMAAPGVIEAIANADQVIIGPSNPPLSIWPILVVAGVREAIAAHPAVTAISPLIGGTTVKGPADKVMVSLGLPPGNAGVAASYSGLIRRLVIDASDEPGAGELENVEVMVTDTLIKDPTQAARLASEVLA